MAKRDIRKQIEAATAAYRRVLKRVADDLLRTEMRELVGRLQATREHAERRDWVMASACCRDSHRLLARVRDDPRLAAADRTALAEFRDDLWVALTYLEGRAAVAAGGKTTATPRPEKKKVFDDLIATSSRVEAQFERQRLQVNHDE